MDDVNSTRAADTDAAAAVERHHAQMAEALALRVETLVTAASTPDHAVAMKARTDLVEWCQHELVPHALAEETAMYPVGQVRPEGRLLVEGMLGEHKVIIGLVDELGRAGDPVRAAATGRAVQAVFTSHLAKENDLLLPLLVGAPDVSLADVLSGMHELLGRKSHPPEKDPDET